MFRTRPPAYALACAALWFIQLCANLLLVFTNLPSGASHYWLLFNLVTTILLGVLILLQLPRALQWRPRRSARPSHELRQERQRIARDLHDQVGSQLVVAMALLDPALPAHKQALRALEQCLLDLRLVVDSMDSTDASLPERLAQLRHRLQPVLQHRGIALEWQVSCTPEEHLPGGDQAAHLAHIAQEALSNLLQHSRATQVQIRLTHLAHEQAWLLEIADNGIGLPNGPAQGATGKGLANMFARAQMAACQLQLLPSGQHSGTCVRIVLPCARCSQSKTIASSARI